MLRCLQQAKTGCWQITGFCVHAMSTTEIAATAQARRCGAHPEGSFAHHLGLYHGSFANSLRSRLRIPATILSATPFSMLRFVGPKI
jgi:hypothetical protein